MKFATIFCAALVGSIAGAQTPGAPSTPPANAGLRLVVPENPAQFQPPQYEITAAWNERTKDKLSVPVSNADDKLMKILGVQATRGIFVVDYPDQIKAKGEGAIDFIYDAADNTDGDMEVIRLKTDQGIKAIHVQIKRDPALTFDTREVRWKVGAKADTKVVNVKMPKGQITPTGVKATAGGNAELEKVDATSFRVKVTPIATDKPTQFAVVVKFDLPLPGAAPVIIGVVGE